MIDFGLADPDVAAHFARALAIIDGPVTDLAERLSTITTLGADTEINRLHHATASGPLDITAGLLTALQAATGALQQVSYLATNPVPTSPIVFQSLLRTALVGSARVAYVLLPANPDHRRDRAAAVLAQDAASGIKALQHYTQFDGLAGVRAPEELLTQFLAQKDELRRQQAPARDGDIVNGMIEAIVDALEVADVNDVTVSAILREHAHWLWNTYSGLAHGYSWPRSMWTLSGDRRIPGDYAMDLHQVSTSAHVALIGYLVRAAPGTAGTTEPVDLRTSK